MAVVSSTVVPVGIPDMPVPIGTTGLLTAPVPMGATAELEADAPVPMGATAELEAEAMLEAPVPAGALELPPMGPTGVLEGEVPVEEAMPKTDEGVCAAKAEEMEEWSAVTGQMVVVTSMMLVTTGTPERAGQSVIVGAHEVIVKVLVAETVKVVMASVVLSMRR